MMDEWERSACMNGKRRKTNWTNWNQAREKAKCSNLYLAKDAYLMCMAWVLLELLPQDKDCDKGLCGNEGPSFWAEYLEVL